MVTDSVIVTTFFDEEEMDRVVRENPKFKSMGNEAVLVINIFIGIQIPFN